MKNGTKAILLTLLIAVVAFAAACPERKSIADIEANPSKYLNKSVAVAGTVQDAYGVNIPFTNVRGGVFKVSDGTGSILVFTQNSVPSKGTQIGVKGKVQNGINWNGRNYGLGIIEEDRRTRSGK